MRISDWSSDVCSSDLVGRDLGRDIEQGLAQLGHLLAALRLQFGRAGIEQHFRLEDEAVADDLHILAATEQLAQAPEELRALVLQLVDLADRKSTRLNSSH